MTAQTALRDLASLIRYQAATRPERVAMLFEGRQTTYGQADARANRVANGLIAACSAPLTRVALLDKSSDMFYEILFGSVKARDVLVAVNWRLAPAEIAYIVNDAQAEVLFVGDEYLPTVEGLLPELPTVKSIVTLSGSRAGWERYADWRDRQPSTDPDLAILDDDVAMQVYTSGTTGHPKGAQLTHENVMTCVGAAVTEWLPCSEDDVILACMPQFHVTGSLVGLCPFFVGARGVITRQVDVEEILRLIPAEGVTVTLFVPAVLLFLLRSPTCASTDFSRLRTVAYGASPIPLDLLRDAMATFTCDFVQVYGLTETTGAITALLPEDHDADGSERMRSCGKPLSTAEILVADETGAPLPPGEVGEVLVRSAQVMKGYWGAPAGATTTTADGWLRTGDAGYFDEDGYLYIHDRVKDMIISGGENVYPAEVESAMFGHPAVADVGVIGVPDERWGEVVKAVVVLKPGAQATEDELIAFARERIAHYKAPKSVDFAESLPRNPSGKILKRMLRAPYWEGRERQVN